MWKILKVNNKGTRTFELWTYFIFCSCVFIANFEHVIAGWEMFLANPMLRFQYKWPKVNYKLIWSIFWPFDLVETSVLIFVRRNKVENQENNSFTFKHLQQKLAKHHSLKMPKKLTLANTVLLVVSIKIMGTFPKMGLTIISVSLVPS